ncbi:hypothetical protein KIN34_09655 [Cellulomonas sp. DKR-3]|uniref:Uncharacterized protein n=1 Tax=Cellulomonas fulva TaxID=2835530 RepID=A0ABS5TZL2_9CELL|nr:hypothetical protein [Cellulomonas fulva]MBT0994550.1 hypothetical protein [Cellulomonas fulva]
MKRYILAGLALAVLTAAVTGLTLLGADAQGVVLLGLALGGALGLVPDGSVAGRAGGFVLGAVLAWAGYLLRAGALPDTAAGRAVAAFVVLALCTAAFAVSRGRLPLWSLLLGAVGVVGAYEAVYATDPSAVTSTSVESVSSLLLASALGLLVGVLVGPRPAAAPAARHTDAATDVAAPDGPSQRGTSVPAGRAQPVPSSSPVTLHPAPTPAAPPAAPLTRDPQEA